MKTNYTPAPWSFQKFGDKYCLTAQHGLREIILSANINEDKSLQPYLSMNDGGILKPINPNHPNAKLISAAPELLECLLEAIESMQLETNNVSEKWIKAVKKATGNDKILEPIENCKCCGESLAHTNPLSKFGFCSKACYDADFMQELYK